MVSKAQTCSRGTEGSNPAPSRREFERTSNYVDLTRRAGTQLLLLKERWSTWGQTGDKAVRQRPIGEVDRANQNRFAPSRQMPLVYP